MDVISYFPQFTTQFRVNFNMEISHQMLGQNE